MRYKMHMLGAVLVTGAMLALMTADTPRTPVFAATWVIWGISLVLAVSMAVKERKEARQ